MNYIPRPKKGFTLIEMLVVIAIIALLASILVPAVTGALSKAQRLRLAASGGGIYKQVFAAATDNIGGTQNFFADSGATYGSGDPATTSTGYFTWLMTPFQDGGAEVLSEDFSVFRAPGTTPVTTIADFDADANPWAAVDGLSETSKSGTPFIVTRNLNETALTDWDASGGPDDVLANVGTGTYEEPYGEEALIVIRSGGASDVLNVRQLTWGTLNPPSEDNDILVP